MALVKINPSANNVLAFRCDYPGLQPDELMVAYQETMLALTKKVREPGFDPTRPLRIVYVIARRKGVDLLRRRKHRMNTNQEELLGAVAASLKDTNLGFEWRLLGPAERKEFRRLVLEIALTLPERQRIVALCYADCFEDVLNQDSYLPLAEAVSAVTGKPETVANVKSAWHVAKKKLAAELARRYTFIPLE